MKPKTILCAALAFVLTPAPGLWAALTRIGAAGGVSGRVVALAPEGDTADRPLSSGKTVFHKDKVTTDSRGRMQVLLLDESTFTIGPDTELILDEFVYDPFTQNGTVSATVTKGVFKFVTGKIARKEPSKVKIELPVGTIGIRGTIGAASTDGKTATVALLGPGPENNADEKAGAITVTNAGVTQEITRPGYAVEIPGADQPPTPPAPMTPEQQAALSPAPKAEPGGGGEEPGGSQASPSEESGQQTAGAGGDLRETQSTETLAQTFSNDANNASQDSAEGTGGDPNITDWSELRTIASGSAFFSGSGTGSCSGGVNCSSPTSQGFVLHFNVDWGARTLGGGGSSSHIAFDSGAVCGGISCPLDSQIPVISYAALQGDAKLTFGTDFTGTNSDFNGSSFNFIGGGHQVQGKLVFNGTSNSGANNNGVTVTGGSLTANCSSGTCP